MENNPPPVSSTDLRRIFTKALVLPDSVEGVHSLIDTCEKYGFRWRQLFIKQMALCPPSPERSALLGTISPLLMGEHAHKEMSAASILDLGRIIIDQKAWDLVPILHAPGRVSNQEFEFGLRHHYVSALVQGTWIDISNFNPPLLSSLDHKQLSDFFWASMSPDRDKLPGDHESDLNIFLKLCDLGMFKDQDTLMRSVSKAIAFRRIECEDWDQFLNAANF